jgi:hypothetical protein
MQVSEFGGGGAAAERYRKSGRLPLFSIIMIAISHWNLNL